MHLNWILCAFLSVQFTINGHIINSEENVHQLKIMKMDVVTGCQISCLDKFLFNDEEGANPFDNIIDQCIERSDCYMCYDFCEMLNEESRMIGKLMCTNDTCVSILKFFTNCAVVKNSFSSTVFWMQIRLCSL